MGTGMWNLLPTAPLWLCCYGVVLAVSLVWLIRGMSKLSRDSQWKLAAEIPPGSQGLPLIGETLHFLAATYSSKGFYDFVHIRLLRYNASLYLSNISLIALRWIEINDFPTCRKGFKSCWVE